MSATPEQIAALDAVKASATATRDQASTTLAREADFRALLLATAPPPPPPNTLPTVALTAPTPGQSFTQGASIALAATAADNDGSIARVEFYGDGALLGQVTAAPYAFTWTPPAAGSHSVHAVAVDNSGGSTQSAAVGITVTAVAPPPPPPPAPSDIAPTLLGTDQYAPSAAANQLVYLDLPGWGSTEATVAVGDRYRLDFSGSLASPNQYANNLTIRVSKGSLGQPTICPWPRTWYGPGPNDYIETLYSGWTNGDGVLNQYTRRRMLAMLAWLKTQYPQLDFTKLGVTGGSMGAWGALQLAVHYPELFAYAFPSRPRWRWSYAVGEVEVANIGSNVVRYPAASAPVLAAIDGGGPALAYQDLIAYGSNAANPLPALIGWSCGLREHYLPWNDNVDAVAMLRARKQPFAFGWDDANHGWVQQVPGQPDKTVADPIHSIYASYGFDHKIGRGFPYFSNSSRDAVLPVQQADGSFIGDMKGGINLGFSVRNIVESATGFACEVKNVLGPTTVTVEPSSRVFTKAVAAQTVAVNDTTWKLVSFS